MTPLGAVCWNIQAETPQISEQGTLILAGATMPLFLTARAILPGAEAAENASWYV